jgi:hypothetical protein
MVLIKYISVYLRNQREIKYHFFSPAELADLSRFIDFYFIQSIKLLPIAK